MKKWLKIAIIIFTAVLGLSLLLYPSISNYLYSRNHRHTIDDYTSAVSELDPVSYEVQLDAARDFNRRLVETSFYPELPEKDLAEYETLLNFAGNGVMGYLDVPAADVHLPIYHGTGDAVLQTGVGHLNGTSLPVGGVGMHTVLTGHRGLPSARLFTDLDRLDLGDTFSLTVLSEVLTYGVDQILSVAPYEIEALAPVEGEDYCTLVTCTPYGVNTNRLLIRGHRIETPSDEVVAPSKPQAAPAAASDRGIDPVIWILIGLAVAAAAIVISLVLLLRTKQPGTNTKSDPKSAAKPGATPAKKPGRFLKK